MFVINLTVSKLLSTFALQIIIKMSKKKTILPPDRYRADFSKEHLDSFWRQEVEKIIPLYINDIRQADTTEELTNILLNFAVHSFNKGFRSR